MRQKQAEFLYQKQMEAIKAGDKKPNNPQVTKSVTINLALPKLDGTKDKLINGSKRLTKSIKKRNVFITGGALGLIIVILFGIGLFNSLNKDTETPQVAGTSNVEKADFPPLIPLSKDSSKKPVITGLCSNDSRLICFEDEYLSGQVNVTQQKLENGEKIDPKKLLDLAKTSFGQTGAVGYDQIQTKNGNAVIVRYDEIKAQRAVYVFQDRLVFVTTEKSYSQAQWKEYFDSFKVAPS